MSKPISYHIFLFPFWYGETFLIDEKNWVRDEFTLSSIDTFNQHAYFHDYAEKAMFDKDGSIVRKYNFNLPEKSTYTICAAQNCMNYEYTLKIDKIGLHIYDSQIGVGILSFHLANYNEASTDRDILRINDFGRRVHPQFLSLDKETQMPTLASVNGAFLAKEIRLTLGAEIISEDFTAYLGLPFSKIHTARHIAHFTGDTQITPAIDDRMFVVSFFDNLSKIDNLKHYDKSEKQYHYCINDFWYEYVFVDNNGKTCQSITMQADLIKKATYDRWIENMNSGKTAGTLYGVTRYSFVALGDPFVLKYIQTLYFEMVVLCLAQQTAILRFSDTIVKLSEKPKKEINAANVSNLYWDYIQFINRLFFREVTAQDQGVEIYEMLQDKMNLRREMKDLDGEINELNTFIQTKEQSNLTETVAYYTPAALLTSILGIIGVDKINQLWGSRSQTSLLELTSEFSMLGAFIFFLLLILLSIVLSKPLFKFTKHLASLLKI